MSKVAVVQAPSTFLNKQKSIELAVKKVTEASLKGAKLIILTEAFISGYPAWIWRLRPGGDWTLSEELFAKLTNNAVNMGSDDLAPLHHVAREHAVSIMCGMTEIDDQNSQSTLYNTLVVIGAEGTTLNRHRKLMPTNPERMIWGFGDASGLQVVNTEVGRIGGLLCWENYMPLARYALYAQGIELYIAPTYDSGEGWIGSLQHIAREGRCWVVGCGNVMQASDIPEDFPNKSELYPNEDEWINAGDSVVIAPNGEIVEGPLHKEHSILYFELDRDKVTNARRALDVCGHYSRPDIFTLNVDNTAQSSVKFSQ